MAQALQEAKAGRLTLQQAAQQFGARKSSLSQWKGEECPLTVSLKFSRVLRDQRVKNPSVVLAGFRRFGLYPLDPMAIDWSWVMLSGPRRVTSSPPPPPPPPTNPITIFLGCA
ncbi:hypothetical protein EYF80_025785 [Liparis tanakae]|uniref:Uncharacterized protein n=1 Tax=Liparis tanakae TaxID=230148 RepID=A0A4Z2HG50_9TELE|nr:hypothetical protein EYF80_025785 [Liparis tanakae]